MDNFPTVKLPPHLTKKKKTPTLRSYNSWDVERDRSEDYYQATIRKDDEQISKIPSPRESPRESSREESRDESQEDM